MQRASRDDAASESLCVLGEPFAIEHSLGSELSRLAAFATRGELVRSPVYRRLADQIERTCRAVEFGRFAPSATTPASTLLRVVSWNIQRGARLDRIVELLAGHPDLADAHVVLLLESDLGMARSDNVNVAREIARRLGYDYVYGNSYLCLSSGNAREATQTRANTTSLSGNAILSRLPLRRAENFSVAITKDKFETREKRLGHKKALWAEVMVGETPLAVAAVHLDSGASSAQRAAQLADVVAKLRARGLLGRSLVGGDFNTTTYDAQSVVALLENLALKLWRGGFPHAIEHYLHPERLYEKCVFDVLSDAGYDFEHYNALGVGTLRYRVGDPGSEGRIRDFLPQPFVEVLRRKLAPYGGAVGLKLDWFAGQGVTPTRAGTVQLESASEMGVSDHDPIWVEIGLSER